MIFVRPLVRATRAAINGFYVQASECFTDSGSMGSRPTTYVSRTWLDLAVDAFDYAILQLLTGLYNIVINNRHKVLHVQLPN
jgi:hypothetical protein